IVSVKTEKLASAKKYAVIYLKEKTSGEIYRVEVSPRWYFHLDLIMGSRIEVTGSFSKSGSTRVIMTRTITSRGKRYHFRDKHGFPMWRGTRKQKRRVKRGRGNGIRRGGR
ncbi:MAG: hypothetical protein GY765_07940, partial [bacterium]|nr:hypothetical protein [bacterium]